MSIQTIHNFSPGPAALPAPVLKQVQQELTNWQNRGYSVMEVSHRSPQYMALVDDTSSRLRSLLEIPGNYTILYLTMSATAHFAVAPMNIAGDKQHALYINTGHWSQKAASHAASQLAVHSIAIDPQQPQAQLAALQKTNPQDYAYAHYCPNETIAGIAWKQRPVLPPEIPLIGDFSSCLLANRINVSDYAMIYASAQKNIGAAGISLVIIRNDLLGKARSNCPPAFNYTEQAKENSLLHTPNTFGIYIINQVCRWLEQQGGLAAMEAINKQKAQALYNAIDNSDLYCNNIPSNWRSTINIPFQLTKAELDGTFLKQAEQAGLLFLKGHKAHGGMRASLYNATGMDAVKDLIAFMENFAR